MERLFTTIVTIAILLTIDVTAYDFDSIPSKISAHFIAPAQSL